MMIIDSGNTACKIWSGSHRISKLYSEEFTQEEIALFQKESDDSVAYSSVAPQKFETILKKLREFGFKKFVNVGEFAKKEKLLGSSVSGIGSDRILGMIGAATFLKTPLITVDCGTAVTVNFLKSKNECEGGAIFAGYSTQLRALTAATEGIREDEHYLFKKALGTTTGEALQSGILHSIAGAIMLLKENFLKETGVEDAQIAVTGGDGELIFKKLREENIDCVFKNDLIKLGIEEVFKNMSEKAKENYSVK